MADDCSICDEAKGHPRWVLCGIGHCDLCCRYCRFCMAELRGEE